MARSTRWERTAYQGDTAFLDDFTKLATLEPGETLTRIRMHVQMVVMDDDNKVADGPTVWGVAVEAGQNDEPDITVFGEPNDPAWVWWEGIGWADLGTWTSPEDGSARFATGGPTGSGLRDIEAMRKAGEQGATVWWLGSTNTLTGSPWFANVSASTLVLEVAA